MDPARFCIRGRGSRQRQRTERSASTVRVSRHARREDGRPDDGWRYDGRDDGSTPWGEGYGSLGVPLQRTVDIKKAESLVNDYLKRFGAKNLKIEEIMEFEYNLYVLIEESDTGKKAFELLVDPFTGAVGPEPGPNMMWNTKYGMMSSAGAVGNTLTAEAAEKIATEYLLRVRGGGPYKVDASEFYGYFTLDYEMDGRVLGMLSVNAFSGQVWYHSWHGGFLGEEEMGKMSM